MKRILYPLLMIAWIVLIFSFSLQPADDSSQISSGLLHTLLDTLLPGLLERLSVEQQELLHFLVRKCAHFTEFAILGVLSALTVVEFPLRRKDWYAFFFCVLVACIDECIQIFSSGRAAKLADVLLDSVGALMGVAVVLRLRRLKGRLPLHNS